MPRCRRHMQLRGNGVAPVFREIRLPHLLMDELGMRTPASTTCITSFSGSFEGALSTAACLWRTGVAG